MAGGVEPEVLLAAIAEDGQDEGKFLSVEYVKVRYVLIDMYSHTHAYMYMCMVPVSLSHLRWIERVPMGQKRFLTYHP